MQYRFVMRNKLGAPVAWSNVFNEDTDTQTLNQNLARWISYGFPACEGEDNGAGIIVPGNSIDVERGYSRSSGNRFRDALRD
jgi:hypothetical protein